ncbi:MAG: hypothetical protein ACT4NY_09205 [Pseudonocardiales bacterium]
MSRASRLGYDGERPVQVALQALGHPVTRPRAGSPHDVGDICGLPLVISVKNWGRPELGTWVDGLPRMIEAAGCETGVVWHKRRGVADPLGWHVTTSGRLFVPLLQAYCREKGGRL